MKNNLRELFYNPFSRVAGWKAFFIGLPVVCITVVLGWLTDTVAFGLEVKVGGGLSLTQNFMLTGIGLACTVVTMYIIGLIFSKNVRFQDILGTVTLARVPYLLSPLLGLMTKSGFAEAMTTGSMSSMEWTLFVISMIFSILLIVWTTAMLYHAFRVSTYLKGAKCTILFIVTLLVSEIIMLVIVSKLL